MKNLHTERKGVGVFWSTEIEANKLKKETVRERGGGDNRSR
jgi:hypothetical protein